ncbi:MAG: mechanosensitive ion channel, partial [Erysipelotrichaceae bacterium]|nr:mechanosensitive ion channel [Erysipelotrichaceae bacterium]
KLLLASIKVSNTFITLIRSLIDYVAGILAVVWSLRILGADINGIIAGLGILGLIIGMSAQDIINDLVTGIFMLFEQEYKVGDIIEVNGFTGKVTEIGVRTTALTDNGGNEKIFNNSAMKNIMNKSSNQSVAVVDITLPKGTDVKAVIEADYGDIKCLGLQEIGGGLTFRFIKECEEDAVYDVRRQMNLDILEVFHKLGVM